MRALRSKTRCQFGHNWENTEQCHTLARTEQYTFGTFPSVLSLYFGLFLFFVRRSFFGGISRRSLPAWVKKKAEQNGDGPPRGIVLMHELLHVGVQRKEGPEIAPELGTFLFSQTPKGDGGTTKQRSF